jgi:cation transporter-like permease
VRLRFVSSQDTHTHTQHTHKIYLNKILFLILITVSINIFIFSMRRASFSADNLQFSSAIRMAVRRAPYSAGDTPPPSGAPGNSELAYLRRIADLELTVIALKSELNRTDELRHKKIDDDVEGGSFLEVGRAVTPDDHGSFLHSVYERGSWLIGLLVFQSFSSFILVAYEKLLADHPDIIFFLTMLVGAGGNAGNQAAVRVIRGIAVGTINSRTRNKFIKSEVGMAIALSATLGLVGFARAILSFRTSMQETLAITSSLVMIVFISVVAGVLLPFLLQYLRFDPAHSSTSIQVIMDILGVLITCAVSTAILTLPHIIASAALEREDGVVRNAPRDQNGSEN